MIAKNSFYSVISICIAKVNSEQSDLGYKK